jgi:hypothetical protein
MPFGIDEEKPEEKPIEVQPRMIDEHRQHVVHCISVDDMSVEDGEVEIQTSIDSMSAKGFKPVSTTLDTENQLYYIIYERREP